MRKIFVTGGSGFIGTTFVEAHRKDYDLVVIDRVPPRERFDSVEYRICDILDRDRLLQVVLEAEPDFIVHLAAKARVDDGMRDPVGTARTNVTGTINTLEAASIAPGLDKYIFVSSETVYGNVPVFPTPEELGPGKPISLYGATKAASDLITQQWPGLRTVVARSAMGAGPRSSPAEQVTSRFIKNVLDGKPLRFPTGSVVHPTRDVSPAWNFVQGIANIIEHGDASGVYNLATGKEISILELAETVVRVMGRGEIKFDPDFHYRVGEAGFRTALSIERAERELGYKPVVSLERCIELTASWMERNPEYWSQRRVEAHDAWRGAQRDSGYEFALAKQAAG